MTKQPARAKAPARAATPRSPGKGTKPAGRKPAGNLPILAPHLVCRGAAAAIAFYEAAFGAEEVLRLPTKDGRIVHARLLIGGALLMLLDENEAWGALSPATLNGTPVTLHLYVDDVDAVFARAVAAGATARMPPADMFWGDRYGVVIDPFGHSWSLATHIKDVSEAELRAAAAAMGG